MAKNHAEALSITNKVMDAMKKSPTCFHVIKNNIEILNKNGYIELSENEEWKLKAGCGYYMTRNNSALIAFKIPKTKKINGFMLGTSHSDHPCYKIINDGETTCDDAYRLVTIEQYPSTLDYTWFDVPLSVGGRVTLKTKDGFTTKIVDVNRPILMIPSLAVHMQKEFEKNHEQVFEFESRMKPLFSTDKNIKLLDLVLIENKINKKDIIDSELFVYRQSGPILWGANNEFMSSRAIDDQLSVYASLFAFIDSKPKDSIAVHAVFDNEEIGSCTTQGANSTLITHTLLRINEGFNGDINEYKNMMSNSFALSIDNAHGLHPNYTDKYNKVAKTYLGKGAVIKHAASYAYCTNSTSYSVLARLCDKNNVKIQKYYNRPGVIPGNTLSRYVLSETSMIGCDVGVAQLAMHSGYETCSTNDILELKNMIQAVYSSSITMKKDGTYSIK